MEKLLKLFTRDFSLAASQWWRTCQDVRFREKLGAGYSDFIAANDGRSSTFYCLEQDVAKLKSALFSRLQDDSDYYFRESDVFLKETQDTKDLLNRLEQEKQFNPQILATLKHRFDILYPTYRYALVLPAAWYSDLETAVPKDAKRIAARAFSDRQKVEGTFERVDAVFRKLLGYALAKQHLPVSWAKWITAEEAENLAQGKTLEANEIQNRVKGYTYCRGKLTLGTDYQKEFHKSNYRYEEEKIQGNQITGQVAYDGGIVEGRVRKLYTIEQADELKTGEILIAPMTIPDFLPSIKRASAIVTDEGGITCHAAIVSRELKVPCIIGTRIATKRFNNGDLVRVDAKNGTVEKIG